MRHYSVSWLTPHKQRYRAGVVCEVAELATVEGFEINTLHEIGFSAVARD